MSIYEAVGQEGVKYIQTSVLCWLVRNMRHLVYFLLKILEDGIGKVGKAGRGMWRLLSLGNTGSTSLSNQLRTGAVSRRELANVLTMISESKDLFHVQ